MSDLFQQAQSAAIRAAIAWLDHNPTENLLKLIQLIEKLDHNKIWTKQLATLKKELSEKEGALYDLIGKVFREVDPKIRSRLAENFILNVMLAGSKKQDEILRKYDKKVPWAILFREDGKEMYAALAKDTEASMKEGIALFLFPEEDTADISDVLRLGEEHPDAVFVSVLRAEEINERVIRRLLHVQNVLPILSGDAANIEAAIDSLRKNRCAFGMCIRDPELLKDEAYLDDWMKKGVINIFVCPDQAIARESAKAYHRLLDEIRDVKPLMSLELWKIAEDSSLFIAIGLGRDAETCMAIPLKGNVSRS